jgi:hypothetical protein
MRKIINVLVPALFGVFITVFCITLWSASSCEQINEKENAGSADRPVKIRCKPFNILFIEAAGVDVAKHPNEAAAGVTALATIAIAWFTLTLKRSTDRLWNITKAAADRQAAHTQTIERAYIDAEPRGVTPFQRGGHADGHVAFRNVGHVPARNVKWFIRIGYDMNVERTQFESRDFTGDNVILPGTETEQWGRDPIAQAEFDGLKGNRGFIYVWGRIEYSDGFADELRSTTFCHRYEGRGFKALSETNFWIDYRDGGAVFHHHGNDGN